MKLQSFFIFFKFFFFFHMLIIAANCFFFREQSINNNIFDDFFNSKNTYSKRTRNNDQDSKDILKYHRSDYSDHGSQTMFNEIFDNFTNTELKKSEDQDQNEKNLDSFFNTKNMKEKYPVKNLQLENLDNIKSSMEAISSEVEDAEEKNNGVKMVNRLADELDLPKFNKWKIISKSELESSTQAKLMSRKTLNKDNNNSISKSKSMEINSKNEESNSSMNFNMLFEGDKLKDKTMDFDVPEDYQINLKDKNGKVLKTLQYKEKPEQPKYIYWKVNKKDLDKIKKLKPDMYEDLYALPGYAVLTDPDIHIDLKSVVNNLKH